MGGAVVDEADDVVEGRVVAELEGVVAFDAVDLADGGEQFGLFDGVDAEVGFEVEVHVEQFGRVAGLFGDEREHRAGTPSSAGSAGAAAAGSGVRPRCALGRRARARPALRHGLGRFDRGAGSGAAAAGAGVATAGAASRAGSGRGDCGSAGGAAAAMARGPGSATRSRCATTSSRGVVLAGRRAAASLPDRLRRPSR